MNKAFYMSTVTLLVSHSLWDCWALYIKSNLISITISLIKLMASFPTPPRSTLMQCCSHTHSTGHVQKKENPIYFLYFWGTNYELCWIIPPLTLVAYWISRNLSKWTLLIILGLNRFPWEGVTVLTSVWHFGRIRRQNIPSFDWHSAWKSAENCADSTEAVESLQSVCLEHIKWVFIHSMKGICKALDVQCQLGESRKERSVGISPDPRLMTRELRAGGYSFKVL